MQKALVERLDEAQDFTLAVLGDPDMAAEVKKAWLASVYGRAKVAAQEHCPIADLLGPPPKESQHLEYKATLRTHADTGVVYKPVGDRDAQTIAAFLNSEDGGTLLLGVNDDANRSASTPTSRH